MKVRQLQSLLARQNPDAEVIFNDRIHTSHVGIKHWWSSGRYVTLTYDTTQQFEYDPESGDLVKSSNQAY